MPTYQYACTACGEQHEAVQSFTDAPLTDCPACAGRLRKVYSAVGVVFKGSGFYKTDSRSGGAKGASDKGSSDKGSSDKGSGDGGGGDGGGGGKTDAPKTDGGAKKEAPATGGSGGASSSPASTSPAAKTA